MPMTGPPAVDFYGQLSGLGDVLQQNAKLAQQQQLIENRKAAFSDFTALDPASPDYGKQATTIAQKLGQAGDQDGAMKFLTVAQSAAERARQATRDNVTDQHWNQSFELQKRAAARADDKTPAGFAKQPDGSYAPIPGGPADPKYLAGRTEAEANAKGNIPTIIGSGSSVIIPNKASDGPLFTNRAPVTTLDEQTVQDMADQYLAGDRTVLQNLGRGAQGAENVVKLRTAIATRARDAGIDPKGIVNNFNEQAGALAGQRAVGTRAANISLAANEANNMIPIALAASDKLPRSQYMPWNQMVQAVQKGASSPELASFVAATNSLVNSYVRAVSPSGVPTDSMRQHAYDMLNAAQGPEAYKSVVDTMKLEMQAALQAPSQVKKELRNDNGGGHSAAPSTDQNVTPGGVKWKLL